MDRRNFLKQVGGLLAAIPALAWMKTEAVEEVSIVSYEVAPDEHWADDLCFGEEGSLYIKGDFLLETPEQIRQRHAEWNNSPFKLESDGSLSDREVLKISNWGNSDNDELYMWNGAGDSWKSSDGGKTWERWGSQVEYEFDDLYLSFEDIHNDFISNQKYFEGLDRGYNNRA